MAAKQQRDRNAETEAENKNRLVTPRLVISVSE